MNDPGNAGPADWRRTPTRGRGLNRHCRTDPVGLELPRQASVRRRVDFAVTEREGFPAARRYPCRVASSGRGSVNVTNEALVAGNGFKVPDGTYVFPFLNSNDALSRLPQGLLDSFSLAIGEIEAGVSSSIHVHPVVTQVTMVLEGRLEVRLKDDTAKAPYTVHLAQHQAALVRPRGFLQLINASRFPCRTLYIVGPSYVFDVGERRSALRRRSGNQRVMGGARGARLGAARSAICRHGKSRPGGGARSDEESGVRLTSIRNEPGAAGWKSRLPVGSDVTITIV